MSASRATEYPLLATIDPIFYSTTERFMEHRIAILEGTSTLHISIKKELISVILMNISDQLKSKLEWASSRKSFFYQCLNSLVTALASNEKVSFGHLRFQCRSLTSTGYQRSSRSS